MPGLCGGPSASAIAPSKVEKNEACIAACPMARGARFGVPTMTVSASSSAGPGESYRSRSRGRPSVWKASGLNTRTAGSKPGPNAGYASLYCPQKEPQFRDLHILHLDREVDSNIAGDVRERE